MAEMFSALNPGCAGCKALALCERAVDMALAELEPDAVTLEQYAADAQAGRTPKISAEYAIRLAEVVNLGVNSVGQDISHVTQKVSDCPGKLPDGTCGQAPPDQLDMIPRTALSIKKEPEYREIAVAASLHRRSN